MSAKKIVITEPVEEEARAKVAALTDEPDMANESPSAAPDELIVEQEPSFSPTEPRPAEAHVPAESPSSFSALYLPANKPRVSFRLVSSVRSLWHRIKRRRRAVVAVCLVVIVGVVAVHVLMKPARNPLPKSLQQEVKFTLYYPHSAVGKYTYVPDSGNYAGGKLTYELGAGTGSPVIRISEQALTVQAPDLHKLQGFSVFQAPAGQAAIGTSGNVLNGVVVAPKTLIILNGLGGVSRQDFTQAINNLKP